MGTSETIQLLERWQQGEQEAAALFERYAQRLINLAQHRLSARLAARLDAQDVVQSAYCTFLVGARDGRYVLERSGDLWRLLVVITLHKVQRQLQYHTAAKRSVHREQRLEAGEAQPEFEEGLLTREPSPEESALLVATLEELLNPLGSEHRRIVELKLQGHSLVEIVSATGLSSSTVRRVLQRVKEQLEKR